MALGYQLVIRYVVDFERDPTLDTLVDLNGQTFFLDETGDYRVNFVVTKVPVSEAKPHGLKYSLTLHGPPRGERLVGFDNAHSVKSGSGPGARRPVAEDHQHRLRTVQPYEYTDAAALLADFWATVDSVLTEKGVSP